MGYPFKKIEKKWQKKWKEFNILHTDVKNIDYLDSPVLCCETACMKSQINSVLDGRSRQHQQQVMKDGEYL